MILQMHNTDVRSKERTAGVLGITLFAGERRRDWNIISDGICIIGDVISARSFLRAGMSTEPLSGPVELVTVCTLKSVGDHSRRNIGLVTVTGTVFQDSASTRHSLAAHVAVDLCGSARVKIK